MAIGIGALLAAGVGIAGSAIASGQKSSADKRATNFEETMFNTTQANLQPYMTAGTGALTQLQIALGLLPPPTTGGTAATPGTPGTIGGGYYIQNAGNSAYYEGQGGGGGGDAAGGGGLASRADANGNINLVGPNGQVVMSWPAGTSQDTINAWAAANNIPMVGGTAGTPGTPGVAGNPYGAFLSSPGYQYALNQGQGAIQNAASAAGGINSGTTLRALQANAMGLANQNWNNWLSGITGVANSGQNAAANLGAIGQNTAANVANSIMKNGADQAAGTAGITNSLTNLLSLGGGFF